MDEKNNQEKTVYEIPDKKNFITNIIEKIQNRKEQKLLTGSSSQKAQTTNASIFSLWNLGDIRKSLFTTFDNVRKSISERFSSNDAPKNTLPPHVFSEDTGYKKNEIVADKNGEVAPIHEVFIPGKKNGIIDNAKSAKDIQIELASINTDAIPEDKKEKLSDEKVAEKTDSTTKAEKESSPVVSQPVNQPQVTSRDDR